MKRRTERVQLLLLALLLIPAICSAEETWDRFRGDAQSTGVARCELPDRPTVLWAARVGEGIESTAAIWSGKAIVGGLDSLLYAFEMDRGTQVWTYKAAGEIKSSPLIVDGVAYFGDSEGVFHAVDARTGQGRWTFVTEGEIISSANALDEFVLFGSYDQHLYCLRRQDGSVAWKVETEGYVHGMPAVTAATALIAGCDGLMRVVEVKTGQEVDQIALGDYVGASAAVRGDRAYVGTYGCQILCVDLAGADVAWRYEHPKRRLPFHASPAVTSGRVIVAGRDKRVLSLDIETGAPQWAHTSRSRFDASPVVAGDRVFVGSAGGKIVALDLETGEVEWEFVSGSEFSASPSVAGGRLVIGTSDGTLYCFGEKAAK